MLATTRAAFFEQVLMVQIAADPAAALSAPPPLAMGNSAGGGGTPEVDAFAALLDAFGPGASTTPAVLPQTPPTTQATATTNPNAGVVATLSQSALPVALEAAALTPQAQTATQVPFSPPAPSVISPIPFREHADGLNAAGTAKKTEPGQDTPLQMGDPENASAGYLALGGWAPPPPVAPQPDPKPVMLDSASPPLGGTSQSGPGAPGATTASTAADAGVPQSVAAPTDANNSNRPATVQDIVGAIANPLPPPAVANSLSDSARADVSPPAALTNVVASAAMPPRLSKPSVIAGRQTTGVGEGSFDVPILRSDNLPAMHANATADPAAKPGPALKSEDKDTPASRPAGSIADAPADPALAFVPAADTRQHGGLRENALGLAAPPNPPQAASSAAPAPPAAPLPAAPHPNEAYAAAVPFSGLAVEIAARVRDGKQRFEIRLDPPELGRIDVRLDLDQHGHVSSRLIVERSETLDLLRRDAPTLERALQSAGLKTDGGIDFSLRDQNSARHRETPEAPPAEFAPLPDEEPAPALVQRGYWRWRGLGGDVDIRV
jgi:flagellar hook-length control protein FliK